MRTAAATRVDPIPMGINLGEEIRQIAGSRKCLEGLFMISPRGTVVVSNAHSSVQHFMNAVTDS